MNRKFTSLAILFIGVSLLIYGLVKAPLINEAEIRKNYACDRITLEAISTDIYCSNPESAPEAKKRFTNLFAVSGVTLIVISGVLMAIPAKSGRKL